MDYAFKYVEEKGIESEANYPYKAVTEKCNYIPSEAIFKINSYVDLPAKDNDKLKAAIAVQPVSIAISAQKIMFYSSGIFDDEDCGTELNHGVLAVGYGSANGVAYWLVKNSWGQTWGENGYIRFERDTGKSTAVCGLNLMASYPTIIASPTDISQ